MKSFFWFCLCAVVFLFGINKLDAQCNDIILNDAKKVNVEVIPMTEDELYFIIRISNLTPNLYVSVYENDNETTTVYNFEDTVNGIKDIEHWYIYEKVNYVVSVYASNKMCDEEVLNKLEVTTKKFNERYGYVSCEENSDYEKCQPFYEEPNDEKLSDKEFTEELEEHVENDKKSFIEKALDFLKKYYLYFVLPIVFVSIIYIVIIIVYKKKRGAKV